MTVLLCVLATLFFTWLAAVLLRIWSALWEQRARGGEPLRMALVLRDRADHAESFVRRAAGELERCSPVQVVLVDGGSADDTAFIMEHLARRFNLGFCRLADLGPSCALTCRGGAPIPQPGPGDLQCHTGTCFAVGPAAGAEGRAGRPARCLDLRGVPSGELPCIRFSCRHRG